MFRQENLTSAQWYERFNTKIDVGTAIRVTLQHEALLNYCSNEHTAGATYDTLAGADKLTVRNNAEERYISYVFLRQSGTQHANLKEDLQNGFTTGDNRYPKIRQETLHLLDKYSKVATPKAIVSEGTLFAQLDNKAPYNKKYWKDKECYNYGKKFHPANHCKKPKKAGKRDLDDNRSVESTADII